MSHEEEFGDLYLEDWTALGDDLHAESLPDVAAPDGSTASTLSSVSSLSCPGGCVYSYTSASSASG
jgi:hypothetical protein